MPTLLRTIIDQYGVSPRRAQKIVDIYEQSRNNPTRFARLMAQEGFRSKITDAISRTAFVGVQTAFVDPPPPDFDVPYIAPIPVVQPPDDRPPLQLPVIEPPGKQPPGVLPPVGRPPLELPGVEPPPGGTTNAVAVAQRDFPWLPIELIELYVQGYADTGDEAQALAFMRADPIYDVYFAGNRAPDGSFRRSEVAYLSGLDRMNQDLASYGLNPEVFQGLYAGLVAGGVSSDELARRLSVTYNRVIQSLPEIRAQFAENEGLLLTDEAIFGMAISPQIHGDVLEHRITIAEIGGTAALRGFDLGITRAGQLASAGLNRATAMDLYSRASRQVPVLQRLATRYADIDPTFDIREFEEAAVFQDPTQIGRAERLLEREAATFQEEKADVARDQLGRVVGLRPR